MPPNAGQKRTAANEPSGSIATGAPKVKRARFASPISAPVNFEEQVDASLENPSAARKGRVKTEGYDSDSSDDGEGVVESRKKSTKKDEDGDEDEDMFAVGDRSDNEENGAGKKKDKEYLKLGDIEGQVFADEKAARGSADEISSEEDEPEDEDDAERRKKAGMGYELSSFNMREEMEEGKFDADGTFLRTFDPHGVHDRWMEGVDEREIKKARRNKKIREREERDRIQKEEDEAVDKEDAERELIGYLHKGETVLEALQRLGIAAKKNKEKHPSTKKPAQAMETDQTRSSATSTTPIQHCITRITDLASILMSLGNTDIYSSQYEQLLRSIRAAAVVPSDWVPPSQNEQYEFRWVSPDQDENGDQGKVYGPYRPEEMFSWHGAKYFGDDGEKVRVRKLGENGWHEWDELMF